MTSFRAMDTDVILRAPGRGAIEVAALVRGAALAFEDAERRFSRFDPTSELASFNRARSSVRVTRPFFDALVDARAYVELTGGLFDPCIGSTLAALGYDRSFGTGLDVASRPHRPADVASFSDVVLDPETVTVTRPEGVTIDLGGMVKGRTVDRVARTLAAPAAIVAGGDGSVLGDGVEGEGYLLDIEDPRDPARVLLSLRISDRAFATSSPNRRRWRVGREERHHLVDPRTVLSSASDLAQVTVLAQSAERADVFAKTLYLLGERGAAAFVARHRDLAAVLVRMDGTTRLLGEMEVVDA